MSYVLILCAVLLGLFSLYKDWQNYKHPRVRKAVAALLLIVGTLSVIKQHRDNSNTEHARTRATNATIALETEVSGLEGQVRAANDAQTQNTKAFLESLTRLSDKLRELQTQVTTEELQKQLASVRTDLQNTQRALVPPKATLLLFFAPTMPEERHVFASKKALPVLPDGTVHVEYTIINGSDVPALDLEITIAICKGCQYAKEPLNFNHLPGQTDKERNVMYQRLYPQVAFQTCFLDIIPPKDAQLFSITMNYRCRTCIAQGESSITVEVTR